MDKKVLNLNGTEMILVKSALSYYALHFARSYMREDNENIRFALSTVIDKLTEIADKL